MANPFQGIAALGGNILGGLGNVVSGVFGTNPANPIGTQVGTAVGNVLGTTGSNPITQQLGQFIGNILGTSGGGGGLFGGGSGGGGISGLLGGGGLGTLLAAGVPAYLLGRAAMEEAENQRGVPLIPLTQETSAGRYNIEAEIRRRMGLPAPDPVEFGLLPRGTLPELSGGRPRPAGGEAVAYEFASERVPNLERATPMAGRIPEAMVRRYRKGGIVSLAEGGEIETEDGEMMDADEFERMNGGINGEGTETSDDVPAMLSDGEFVMTGQAVRGAGSYDLDVNEGGIITLTPGGEESRERGTDIMYQMMALFEEFAGAPEEDD